MNTQPHLSQFEQHGARPPAPSALTRYMPYLRGMVAGGALVGLAAGVATAIFPDGYRPGDLAGKFAGGASKWDNKEATDAAVERERRIAEAVAKANADAQMKMQVAIVQAQAEAQAKMQIDVEANRQTLEAATQSNGFNAVMAGFADAICIGSGVVKAVGVQNTGRGWQDSADTAAGVTCGLGNLIRGDIARSQNRAVVAATTARGLPQAPPTLPAAQQVLVPQPRAIPAPSSPEQVSVVTTTTTPRRVKAPVPAEWRTAIRSLDDVYAINEPSEHFTPKAVSEASVHASRTLPTYVYNRITDGLGTSEHDQDVFVERARIAMSFLRRNL